MKKTIKKITNSMVMCTLALGLLSGCGGEFAEEMVTGKDGARPLTGSAVSGQAVSGQAVSGQAVQPDDHQEEVRGGGKSRYCSEHCYYEETYLDDCEDGGIEQTSLDTNKKKKFKVDGIDEVVYVEKDALYYIKEEDGDEYKYEDYYSLWRVPIECHADGTEVLKTDQAEKLKGLDDIYYETDDIYIDDEYIVYSGNKGETDDTDVIRYDRKSAEKVSMPISEENEIYLDYDINEIHRYGDRLVLVIECGIVSWDMDNGEVSVYADEDWENADEDVVYVSMEKMTFFSRENLYEGKGKHGVTCINMETGKMTEFVSKKEILDVLAEEVGIQEKKLEYAYMNSMYYDANCLYIQLGVEYKKGDSLYECHIMLSRNNEEGSQLKYEKDLTEYMWEEEKEFGPGERAKAGKTKCGLCYGINQGMAYVMPDMSDRGGKMVIYDLKTGKVRPADWKDKLMFDI